MELDFISNNAALFISAIAVVTTLRSNAIANKAKKLAEKVHAQNQELILFKQRTTMLEEVDKQQALLKRLNTITYQKMTSCEKNSKSYKRLENNVEGIVKMRSGYEKQRDSILAMDEKWSIDKNEKALANIRRLTLHLEQDIESELAEKKG